MEGRLQKFWSCFNWFSRPYCFNYFKCCLSKPLLGQLLISKACAIGGIALYSIHEKEKYRPDNFFLSILWTAGRKKRMISCLSLRMINMNDG